MCSTGKRVAKWTGVQVKQGTFMFTWRKIGMWKMSSKRKERDVKRKERDVREAAAQWE
jgi:hypothetical protein